MEASTDVTPLDSSIEWDPPLRRYGTDAVEGGPLYPNGQEPGRDRPASPPPELGRKDDAEKLRMDLLSPTAMQELARVLTYGANKYAPRNWEKGIPYGRVMAAALRHIFAWLAGEKNDPDSGIGHLSHAFCNLMFLVHFERSKTFSNRQRAPIEDCGPDASPD